MVLLHGEKHIRIQLVGVYADAKIAAEASMLCEWM